MRKPPTVAVIIPTYNRIQFLVQALESVLNQSRPADEIIVVDDGSADPTAAVLAEYKGRIRYLRKANGGLPSALNHGLAATEADYVAILDDDDLAMPDALARHLEFLGSRPELDFSYSGCYRFFTDTPPTPPHAGYLQLYDCADVAPVDLFLYALETYPFHTQSLLVPLRCYRAIGGFDESRRRSEDYDMILRLSKQFHGAKLGSPTFLLREHSGDRGPAEARHDIRERDKVFLREGKKLFADLRSRLSLADYIQQADKVEPLSDTETRRALLQRACVMALHGLFDEALNDLAAATAPRLLRCPVTQDEQHVCARMTNLDPMLLQAEPDFPRKVAKVLAVTPPLLYASFKGLSWSISREYNKGNYRMAAEMARELARAVGFRHGASLAGTIYKRAMKRRKLI